jgi:predicted Ser/Thr protein kinase/tetratricopeptide (TPR) repeat protein
VIEPIRLGRYEVEKVLGKGAMGTVYLGRDPVIGRQLALKTLNVPSETDEAEEFRQRFLREAQAVGILTHSGIVTVYDAGVDDASGLSFIAMEFIEGKSLKDMLRAGHMFAFSEVARIGAALGAALDYAHSKGVVHRDIKPANILVTPQGVVKITDFGVARLESSNLTATGQFIGTPNYMSPEQVTGAPVDGRSDLFSLGVVLFELMTGQRPFTGGSVTEVGYKIVHEPPPIPSQMRPGLPPAFNPIVLKLLEKDPAKRYQKGADVARALEALRRVLSGAGGEVVAQAAPAGVAPAASAMNVAATATRATVLTEAPAAEPPAEPSVWRLAIETRWVVTILATATAIPLAIFALLFARIDRGPWPTPPPGEPERRHSVGAAQRQAERALREGRPEEAERLLVLVFDQAPYSPRARELQRRAAADRARLSGDRAKQEQVRRLVDEGQDLMRQGRYGEARSRFEEALALAPDDALVREWAEYLRERARSPRASRPQPAALPRPAAPAPAVATGPARLELYFNSPLPSGTVEIDVDGTRVHDKAFNFYQKGFLGTKKKGSGIVQDSLSVDSGSQALTVRLRGDQAGQLWEQQIPVSFTASGRYMLKIEMEGEQGVPRFSVNQMRAR